MSSALALLVGCVGRIGDDDDASAAEPDPSTMSQDPAEVSSSALRRLSVHELANTYAVVAGLVPEAIDRMPPDGLGHSFDRVVNAQTMSPAHLEAFTAMAEEASGTLIADRSLSDIVQGCAEADIPSLATATSVEVQGAALGLYPEWSVATAGDPTHGATNYAPDVQAIHTHTFKSAGEYELRFGVNIDGVVDLATISVDGQAVTTLESLSGPQQVVATVAVPEGGSHVIELALETTPDDGSLSVDFVSLTIEGPSSGGAEPDDAAVRSCAQAVVDELMPRAYRRLLSEEERVGAMARYDEVAIEHGSAAALDTLLQRIFSSPNFLFLVEIGELVQGREGVYALGPHEIAARLSYALCESPPDDALWDAAAGGELVTAVQIEAQAERLLASPCAEPTVTRFFEHWLWLNRLPELAKSAEVFPDFTEAVRAGLVAESDRFIYEMVWQQSQPLPRMFDSDVAWPDPASAPVYGMAGADGHQAQLPAERRGILTSPSILAVTGSFDGTSPVTRGVYVLEQVLCHELPSPPATDDIVPPPPDPDLTTRERWAAHTDNPTCAGCHQAIDPIGFALEDFDGIGRFRTQENGHPVDASGGVPSIGVDDGEIEGGAQLSTAIADSPELTRCAATQWLRFVLGRLETEADDETITAVAQSFDADSIRDAMLAIATSDAFLHRTDLPSFDSTPTDED